MGPYKQTPTDLRWSFPSPMEMSWELIDSTRPDHPLYPSKPTFDPAPTGAKLRMALVLYAGAWPKRQVTNVFFFRGGPMANQQIMESLLNVEMKWIETLKFKGAKVSFEVLTSKGVPKQLSPIQAGLNPSQSHDHTSVVIVCWPVQEDFQWPVYTLVDSVMPRKHQLDDIPAADYLMWPCFPTWNSQHRNQSVHKVGKLSYNILKPWNQKNEIVSFRFIPSFWGEPLVLLQMFQFERTNSTPYPRFSCYRWPNPFDVSSF